MKTLISLNLDYARGTNLSFFIGYCARIFHFRGALHCTVQCTFFIIYAYIYARTENEKRSMGQSTTSISSPGSLEAVV